MKQPPTRPYPRLVETEVSGKIDWINLLCWFGPVLIGWPLIIWLVWLIWVGGF